jgi:hypothetical protein
MAILDFLFEGNVPPETTSQVTTQTNLPDWYQSYQRGLLSRANVIAATPYQAYTGQRLAAPTADLTQAYDLTRQTVGAADPMLNSAQAIYTQLGQGFNQTEFDKYMNPYTEGVVNRIADLGARNLSEQLLPQVNEAFTGAGQWGSSRHADFTNRALRDTQEAVLGKQAESLMGAQQNAMGNYIAGQTQLGQTGNALALLGGQQQTAGLKDAAALQAIGQEQMNQGQRNLDVAYQDFVQQRDYPQQQAAFMNQMLRGLNPQHGTSSTTTAPYSGQMSASPLAQLASLGSAGAAIYNAVPPAATTAR